MSAIVLKDGGAGQELIHRSSLPPHPLWSAKVMLDEPELVQAVHEDFMRAGARLITLNTYSTTPERLEREAAGELFHPLYAKALELAERARDVVGAHGVKLAACLPPLHGSYHPDMAKSAADLLPAYRQIAQEQAGGVDVMLCETLSSVAEAVAATKAARETGLPVITSITLMDDGSARLRSREALADAIAALAADPPDILSLNCSRPETVDAHLPILAASGLRFGAYANGFRNVDALDIGGTVGGLEVREDVTPENYTGHALGWLAIGATFLGGCCEIGPGHIAHLSAALSSAGHDITGEPA